MAEDPIVSIVDDDDSLRLALVGLVRALGYGAAGFASAEAFLGSGAAQRSAVVITDIHMPGMSGIDLKARLVAGGSPVPVIMMTARTETDLIARAQSSGALCVLRKPFTADALIACIERAIAAGHTSV